MTRVLFVCLGNICRSPTAEGVFQQALDRAGLSKRVEIDSCGVLAVGMLAKRPTPVPRQPRCAVVSILAICAPVS